MENRDAEIAFGKNKNVVSQSVLNGLAELGKYSDFEKWEIGATTDQHGSRIPYGDTLNG